MKITVEITKNNKPTTITLTKNQISLVRSRWHRKRHQETGRHIIVKEWYNSFDKFLEGVARAGWAPGKAIYRKDCTKPLGTDNIICLTPDQYYRATTTPVSSDSKTRDVKIIETGSKAKVFKVPYTSNNIKLSKKDLYKLLKIFYANNYKNGMCKKWKESFEEFVNGILKAGWLPGKVMTRKNVNHKLSPSNILCRFRSSYYKLDSSDTRLYNKWKWLDSLACRSKTPHEILYSKWIDNYEAFAQYIKSIGWLPTKSINRKNTKKGWEPGNIICLDTRVRSKVADKPSSKPAKSTTTFKESTMDIDVIKKYKACFDKWVIDRDKCWLRKEDDTTWTCAVPLFCTGYVYVIADKYSKFRKAIADGKPVYTKSVISGKWAQSMRQDLIQFTLPVDHYSLINQTVDITDCIAKADSNQVIISSKDRVLEDILTTVTEIKNMLKDK